MGLDMYLYAELYVSPYIGETYLTAIEPAVTATGLPVYDDLKSFTISSKAAYWRKANQIHNWFVTNVQGGKDECQRSHVTLDQLRELRDLCQRVIDGSTLVAGDIHVGTTYAPGGVTENYEPGEIITNPEFAAELLPAASGFFFGSTAYDSYYVADLRDTIEQLDRILANPNAEAFDYYYQSSW